MAQEDIRERLRRLGLVPGVEGLRPRPSSRRRAQGIEELLPGEVAETDSGSYFLHRETYELEHVHGRQPLASLLAHDAQTPAFLARDPRLADVDIRHMAFLDTETTGLAGGTGTYAFLVGVGFFDQEGFALHQFFMRDYDEEPAQLQALGALLDGMEAVVSFNGKSFDLPLLESRFVMTRQQPRLVGAPHLDLLPAARRVWKYRLDSCALSSLEEAVLGVARAEADVPGWLIPDMYVDYARSGDAREMPRIFYHNAQDILSLVSLAAHLCDLLVAPLAAPQIAPQIADGDLPGEDLYGLGRLFHDLEQAERAEAAFVRAARSSQTARVREMAMRDLAYLLKRQERRQEALAWWQELARTEGAVYACEELAKHFEWHEVDLVQALDWTRQAQELASHWSPGIKRRQALADLKRREERLQEKLVRLAP